MENIRNLLCVFIILLFLFVNSFLTTYAQDGTFFDALCGAFVDNVNKMVTDEEVDPQVKQIQKSAVKAVISGNDKDWDEFVDSTKNWAESTVKTETKKSSAYPSQPEAKKFVQTVESTRKEIGKTYYFEGKVGNIDFTMEVPPFKNWDDDLEKERYFNREAKIYGIFPINQSTNESKDTVQKAKSFISNLFGGESKYRYLVFMEVVDADTKGKYANGLCHGVAMDVYGLYAVMINEKTNYLNVFDDATKLFHSGYIGGWDYPIPELDKNLRKIGLKWNIPDIFVYDLDHDGFDEVTLLTRGGGAQGVYDYHLIVYSTRGLPMKELITLNEVVLYVMAPKISDGKLKVKYRNINFDGNNLYVDGKNIMDYQ